MQVATWQRVFAGILFAALVCSAVGIAAVTRSSGSSTRAGGNSGIEFGIWVDDPKGGEPRFVATREVPYVADQAFGWRVKNATPGRPVRWVETMRLPTAPSDWLGVEQSPNVQISDDGRTARTMGAAFKGDRYIQNIWYVSAGDPMGECELSVELEDGRKAAFHFRIVLPKDGRKPAFDGVET